MSATTHDFQIGQRVVIVNLRYPSGFVGLAGTYVDDRRDGRPMVRLDADGGTYAFHPSYLAPEPGSVHVNLTEPEAKLVRMTLAGLMRSESGTSHEIMRLVVEKIDRALPHSEA